MQISLIMPTKRTLTGPSIAFKARGSFATTLVASTIPLTCNNEYRTSQWKPP